MQQTRPGFARSLAADLSVRQTLRQATGGLEACTLESPPAHRLLLGRNLSRDGCNRSCLPARVGRRPAVCVVAGLAHASAFGGWPGRGRVRPVAPSHNRVGRSLAGRSNGRGKLRTGTTFRGLLAALSETIARGRLTVFACCRKVKRERRVRGIAPSALPNNEMQQTRPGFARSLAADLRVMRTRPIDRSAG